MPPRRWQFDSRRIYVRPRTGPQSAHGYAAGSQRAYSLGQLRMPRAAAPWNRRTERIAVSLNARYDGEIMRRGVQEIVLEMTAACKIKS